MKITRIERQKKNPRRYNIYIDDEFALGLDKNVIVDYGLRKGDSVDESLLQKLQTKDELMRAYQIALRYLSYRPRSIAEIRTRLERENFHPENVEQTIHKLIDEGQLDDVRFAELYTESKLLHKPIGAYRLRRELKQKGISKSIIKSVEEKYYTDEIELDAARRLAKKKLKIGRATDPQKQKKRLADFLARRGFGWEVIQKVLKELF